MLHEPDTGGILGLLVQNQEESLRRTIDESRQKLSKLAELQKNLTSFNTVTPRSIGVMANIMDGNKKLRAMRIQMLAVGLVMDAAWISTLVYGIVTGTWWSFAIGLAVAVVLGVAIERPLCAAGGLCLSRGPHGVSSSYEGDALCGA